MMPEQIPISQGRVSEHKKSGKGALKSILAIALIGGAIAGYLLVYKRPMRDGSESSHAGVQAKAPVREMAEVKLGPVFVFDTFIVNVAETSAHRYLKCTIAMELDDSDGITEANEKVAMLRDVIIDVLSSKRLEDLEAGEPRDALRVELADKISGMLSKAAVKRVFFNEFVVQ